ncbi:beta-glucosidase [Leifsonia sp. EB41]|uniref:glycoside hydrolase family 3 protein n=1 Tax=Leifsonia sp. EB41 TaxID=3156260 RepID=UPI0035196B2F
MTTPDYLDPSLTPARRTADLIPRMTLEEKAGLLFHPQTELPSSVGFGEARADEIARGDVSDKLISHFNVLNGTSAVEVATWTNRLQEWAADTRLGIPITFSSDPRNGYRSTPFTGQTIDELSKWPEPTGLGAIGDPERAREFGDAIRKEFLAMGIRVYLGPMADLYTEPRWTRGFGTFGEDVRIVSGLTRAFIAGLRGGSSLGADSVAAVLKHFPGAGPQKDGNDAVDSRFPDQVYPGGRQELHLQPFVDAIADGVTQVMTYYGRPVGTEWEEVGFAFNAPVVRDLLRGRLGYGGIVMSDWNVVGTATIEGKTFGPNAYGVEDRTIAERLSIALTNGIDQFGGDTLTAELAQAVRDGLVHEGRIDKSVERLLLEKFRLGLFERRYVDLDNARVVGSDPELAARGTRAQADAMVFLSGEQPGALPVRPLTRVYAEGVDLAATDHDFVAVDAPDEAEIALVQLDSPWESDPASPLGDYFRTGSLEFADETVAHLRELASRMPVLLFVYLERPAVLTAVAPHAAAIVGHFGASDQVIVDAIAGGNRFGARLPFDLPRSMAAVETSREDVPFDTADPLFRAGDGGIRTRNVPTTNGIRVSV